MGEFARRAAGFAFPAFFVGPPSLTCSPHPFLLPLRNLPALLPAAFILGLLPTPLVTL